MRHITLKLTTLQQHGDAFWDYLRLRKKFFVDELGWDIPHNADLEMDQYDNPETWYSLVLRGNEVLGGARVIPTTTVWGECTYMVRDAFNGRLAGIPREVMPTDSVSPRLWECSRLVIADHLDRHEKSRALDEIVAGLIEVASENGASELMTLSTLAVLRALRGLGFDVHRMGERYRDPGDGRLYAVMSMPVERPDQPGQLLAAE